MSVLIHIISFPQIINFYMNMLMERSKEKGLPSVHAFNTFFFTKLKTAGYQAVKRWTKKVDVFSADILLVPIHLGVHWCLAVSTLLFLIKFKRNLCNYRIHRVVSISSTSSLGNWKRSRVYLAKNQVDQYLELLRKLWNFLSWKYLKRTYKSKEPQAKHREKKWLFLFLHCHPVHYAEQFNNPSTGSAFSGSLFHLLKPACVFKVFPQTRTVPSFRRISAEDFLVRSLISFTST